MGSSPRSLAEATPYLTIGPPRNYIRIARAMKNLLHGGASEIRSVFNLTRLTRFPAARALVAEEQNTLSLEARSPSPTGIFWERRSMPLPKVVRLRAKPPHSGRDRYPVRRRTSCCSLNV